MKKYKIQTQIKFLDGNKTILIIKENNNDKVKFIYNDGTYLTKKEIQNLIKLLNFKKNKNEK